MSPRRLPRPRLTYANVMSTLGVFIALGGTSYAVTKLPKNSVGTPQLRAGAVTGEKLGAGAVTAEKLAAGVAMSGPRGPRGATGPQGTTGDRGPASIYTTRGGKQLPNGTGMITIDTLTLPAGNYWLIATGSFVGGDGSDWYRCSIPYGTGIEGSVGRFGTGSLAAAAGAYALQGYAQLTATTTLNVECGHDAGPINNNPRIDHGQFTAIRTDDLQLR